MFDRPRAAVTATATRWERGAWPLTLALLATVWASSLALIGLVEGAGWWFALVATSAFFLLLPAVLRTVGMRRWAASLVTLVVLAAFVDAVYGGRHTVLEIFPTPTSVHHVVALFQLAGDSIERQAIPAVPVPELLFFIVVFSALYAILVDVIAVALRLPALVALAMLAVLVIPAVVLTRGAPAPALIACAAAYLLVLFADGRLRLGSRGGAAGMSIAATAVVLALVVAWTAPGFTAVGRAPALAIGAGAGGVSLGSGVNPLIDLSHDLTEGATVPVLQYTTKAENPPYLQLTTLDSFSGTVWQHRTSASTLLGAGGSVPRTPGLGSGIQSTSSTTRVDIENLVSPWYPVPYPAVTLAFGGRRPAVESDDLTVDAAADDLSSLSYTVVSRVVDPTAAQFAASAARSIPASLQRDLQLPGTVPSIITDTTQKVVKQADATTPLEKAIALQDYFQGGDFSYSTDTPSLQNGSSLVTVARFLQSKTGYCVHFASAMAIMARLLGIPSRIAMGYLPGQNVGTTDNGATVYQEYSDDLHAWPQLYFPGIGWLSFEPTVSRGIEPAYSTPVSTSPGVTVTTPAVSPTDVATPSSRPTRALPQPVTDPAHETQAVSHGRPLLPLLLLALVILAVLVTPATVRAARRARRLRLLRAHGGPPGLAWAELCDTARDLGVPTLPTETPRAYAARLEPMLDPDAAPAPRGGDTVAVALHRRLASVERAAYGPSGTDARDPLAADDVARLIAALRAGHGRTAGLMATFAPASLVARRSAPAPLAEHGADIQDDVHAGR